MQLYRNTVSVVVDHYVRNCGTDTLRISVRQADKDGNETPVPGDVEAPIREIDELVEKNEIVGFDAAVAAYVSQIAGIKAVPRSAPKPLEPEKEEKK